jgi:hypothetical protein
MKMVERRLSGLRRRICGVTAMRAVSWLISVPLLTILIAGWLDWRLHLPSMVRGSLLALALCAAGGCAFWFLFHSAWARLDLLSLALRIERYYPQLNDSLASVVQFMALENNGKQCGSAAMRHEVARRAAEQISALDLQCAAPAQGVTISTWTLGATLLCAATLVIVDPVNSFTALWRFADPFGGWCWPKQTYLLVQTASPLARGQPVEIQAHVSGVIPAHGIVEFEGISPVRQVCDVLRDRQSNSGTLLARRGRAEHNFRFRITANDAVSEWSEVTVLPPPALAALDGRPSPQVRLKYPAYTELPPENLPDGSGNIDAVRGTRAFLTAYADRPIRRAWIEYQPEAPTAKPAALTALLAIRHPLGVLALTAASRDLWDLTAVNVSADGRILTIDFVPQVTGTYSVSMEDQLGLVGSRFFGLRVFLDPAPAVWLEHPSKTTDRPEVVSDAVIPVTVMAEDSIYGIRSVRLEYRIRGDGDPKEVTLWKRGMGKRSNRRFIDSYATNVNSNGEKPTRLQTRRPFSLREVRHSDGSALKGGDTVVLQAVADDFDDVSVNKQPGRSDEVEILVTGLATSEAISHGGLARETPTPEHHGAPGKDVRALSPERSTAQIKNETKPAERSSPHSRTGTPAVQAQPAPGSKGAFRGEDSGFSGFPNVFKETWGHLPETLRQDVDQYAQEQFMAKYRALIEQYYATVAEKAHKQGN